ncbi:MAG: type III pantothenate kinase [Raoultibacter sp.]
MLLAIDVGNTQTVLGVYDNEHLKQMWRVTTNPNHTSDELRLKLRGLFLAQEMLPSDICGVALASVVPTLTNRWAEVGRAMFGEETFVVSFETARPLFQADYANPYEIGADRIADAVAAKQLYGSPVIVVDFGTATNMEVIDCDGRFVGGIIAPGIETSMTALFSRAARLAAIELEDPHTAIGGSTAETMQVGIVYGEVDRVDGLVRRVFAQLGYEAPVVATGGLSTSIATLCTTVTEINPELTLQGLRMLFEQQIS